MQLTVRIQDILADYNGQTLSFPGVKNGDLFTRDARRYLHLPGGITHKAVRPDDLACPTFGLQDPTILGLVTTTGYTLDKEEVSNARLSM